MNNSSAANAGALDAQELLHLALQAMQQDRDEDAITCLKRGIALEPKSGLFHHLLGAMYAQLGMIDRGIDEMTQALTHTPQLHICRFQLGLLHFTSMDMNTAEQVWQPLAELPEENPLRLFRSGLLHLARDEYSECASDLRRGVELNREHPSLNRDMLTVVEIAEKTMQEGTKPSAAAPTDSGATRHVLLSGYEGLSSDQKN